MQSSLFSVYSCVFLESFFAILTEGAAELSDEEIRRLYKT
jgi:hypothetical protein